MNSIHVSVYICFYHLFKVSSRFFLYGALTVAVVYTVKTCVMENLHSGVSCCGFLSRTEVIHHSLSFFFFIFLFTNHKHYLWLSKRIAFETVQFETHRDMIISVFFTWVIHPKTSDTGTTVPEQNIQQIILISWLFECYKNTNLHPFFCLFVSVTAFVFLFVCLSSNDAVYSKEKAPKEHL